MVNYTPKRGGLDGDSKRVSFDIKNIISPQRRRERRENLLFSFVAETPTNENHHAFGKKQKRQNLGNSRLLAVKTAHGLEFISFRPSQRKEIR